MFKPGFLLWFVVNVVVVVVMVIVVDFAVVVLVVVVTGNVLVLVMLVAVQFRTLSQRLKAGLLPVNTGS